MKNIERETIQTYINNFRRYISKFLKKDVGIKTIIFQYDKGVIMSFEFGMSTPNKDEFRTEAINIIEAIKRSGIISIDTTNEKIVFQGTNIVMEKNQIFIIKDFEDKEWIDKQSQNDVNKIVNPPNHKI